MAFSILNFSMFALVFWSVKIYRQPSLARIRIDGKIQSRKSKWIFEQRYNDRTLIHWIISKANFLKNQARKISTYCPNNVLYIYLGLPNYTKIVSSIIPPSSPSPTQFHSGGFSLIPAPTYPIPTTSKSTPNFCIYNLSYADNYCCKYTN